MTLANGLARTPQMGWNSWNHFGCDIDEATIRETASSLVQSGLAAAGYSYVNVDDCWADVERDKNGYLIARPSTFPSGIKGLSDFIHSLGLQFGIYSDAGDLTCALQPGSLGFEEKDAQTFADWEVDYLKYDNCFSDGTPPKGRYEAMRDALNKTGRPILFSMCDWGVERPALWGRDVGNSWRTTGDIEDFWESMIEIAVLNNEWADFAGPGGWNDPDMLEVGNGGMSEGEYKVHFSLWALMKAPLLIGCDIRNLTNVTKQILTNSEVIAVNQDPLGIQGRRVRHIGLHEIWAGPLSLGRVVVALVNREPEKDKKYGKYGTYGTYGKDKKYGKDGEEEEEEEEMITAQWGDVGLDLGTFVEVRDLWERETLEGSFVNSLSFSVPPRNLKMFILTPLNISGTNDIKHKIVK